jgi:hypothetical protein
MPNLLISKYAKLICDVFDNNEKFCTVTNISDRAVVAGSRMGVTLVIATGDFDIRGSDEHTLKKFGGAWFVMYLIALQQRYSLIGIKRCFSLLPTNDISGRRSLRERLVNFYATSYFTTVTDDELGDNIYRTWHDALRIEDLKTDIMEQINQHDEFQSKKLTSNLERYGILVTAVVIFGALFEGLASSRDIGLNSYGLPFLVVFLIGSIIIGWREKVKKICGWAEQKLPSRFRKKQG